MILNVSGRTDIVAFYTDWFMNRLKEGYVDVRNPFNPQMVSRIYMEDVDLICFCTKNPIPILNRIKEIDKKVYFHITLTGYQKDIEPGLPDKKDIIKAIKELSQIIGKDNIVIRYDPIFISDKYNVDYHIKAFEKICEHLSGYVSKILIHFINDFKNVQRNYNVLKFKTITQEDYIKLAIAFGKISKKYNVPVFTCNEEIDFTEYGFIKDECLSKEIAYKLTGKIYKKKWNARKDLLCNCVNMVDIGSYNSCKHFCKYCYANFNEKEVLDNFSKHDVSSSLLVGKLKEDDIIKVRKE